MLSSRANAHNFEPQIHSYNPGNVKTPGRAVKSTSLRENATTHLPMTGGGKGKRAPQTPFNPKTLQPQRLFAKDDLPSKPLILNTVSVPNRPLLDKTPFPNRKLNSNSFQTPYPTLKKLALLEPPPPSVESLRPSSARKSLRVPRSASRSFETPVQEGKPWDVSDVSICVPDAVEAEPEAKEDYDELEYMPPKVEVPYRPPFDFELPDYREVGASLRTLMISRPLFDPVPYELDALEDNPLEIMEIKLANLNPEENEGRSVLAGTKNKLVPKPVPKPPSRVPPRSTGGAPRALSTTAGSASTAPRTRPTTAVSGVGGVSRSQTVTGTSSASSSRLARPPALPINKPSTVQTRRPLALGGANFSANTTSKVYPRAPVKMTVPSRGAAGNAVTTGAVTVIPRLGTTRPRVSRPGVSSLRTQKASASSDKLVFNLKSDDLYEDFKFNV